MPVRRATRYNPNPSAIGMQDTSRSTQKSYGVPTTATRRHEYSTEVSQNLSIGQYFGVEMIKFKRTFDSATGNDIEPTATASNNYQTSNVMNGSRIGKFKTTVRIHNDDVGGDAVVFDIYGISLSFYDALVWNTISPSNCPVEMDTTAPLSPPYDLRGEVAFKSTPITFTQNNFKNYKFVQHYMKYLGTTPRIYSDADTSGQGSNGSSQFEFQINGLPAKNRRSNVGNFYGLLLHYDSQKNAGGSTASIETTCESSFEEYPATERIPWSF